MNKNKRNAKILTSLQERTIQTKLSGKNFSVKIVGRGADGKKGTDDDKIHRKSKTKVRGDSMGEGKIDEVNLAKVTDDSLKKRMKQLRTGGKTEMPSVQFMIKKISKEMKKRGLKVASEWEEVFGDETYQDSYWGDPATIRGKIEIARKKVEAKKKEDDEEQDHKIHQQRTNESKKKSYEQFIKEAR